jgi:hypothetical protein
MKSYADVADVMDKVFHECHSLRQAGQKEYANSEANALSNFENLSKDIGVSRETVLFIFMKKHIDGIASYIKGHKSQREDVRGRINDSIVYLCLLRAMVEDNELPLNINAKVL